MFRFKKLDLQGWSTLITLIIAVVAALNSVFGFVTKEIMKKHSMKVDLAAVSVVDNKVSYTIAFINEGDFPEIVSAAESFLGQKIDGYKENMAFPQRYCFKPLVVPSKENKVIVYETEYDINDPNLNLIKAQKKEFEPTIVFKIKGPDLGIISLPVKTGVMSPPNFDFVTQTIRVDFKQSRPHIIKGSYPVEKEFSKPSICSEK